MRKWLKRLIIAALIVLLLAAGLLLLWALFLFPTFFDPNLDAVQDETSVGLVEIASESDRIDFDEESGILYVNNEVVVFFRESASEEKINEVISAFDVEVDDSMADIALYKFIFSTSMPLDELEDMASAISAYSQVEYTSINTVVVTESDAGDDDDFEYRDATYPQDDWNGDGWNTAVPSGENWGMEAINAPGAWGYLDELSTVKIGLIDSMPSTSHEDLTFANTTCLFIDEDTGLTSENTYTITAEDHGSHVAGIMSAEWNNGIGVAGVMGGKGELYYCGVYYDQNGTISTKYQTAYTYLLALKALIDQDVQVINISQHTSRLVGFAASHGNQNAINYLTRQATLAEKGLSRIISAREAQGKSDFVICVSAGNSNNIYYYADEDETYGYREEISTWESIKYLFGWRGEIGGSLAKYNNFLSLISSDTVKNRIIVVGAIGIDSSTSTTSQTRYSYAAFSCVGDRVDIVAPGVAIYSCYATGFGELDGTSMSAPHVSGVAGLIFAANPLLTGPEVKEILLASTTGRYYYSGGYSGLINAEAAVVNALKTRETSVARVIQTEADDGLDLCFVIDTTGSMGDDIDSAKESMEEILNRLSEKTENYQVAIIDYRDYADRTGDDDDYPCAVQLEFTSTDEDIIAAIDALELGNGGDTEETVYSALMAAVELDWRSDAKKVIIILGDAAPLDPEPYTEYTYDQVLLALFNADISLDYEDSDERVVASLDDSLINVYTIGTGSSGDAADFFEEIADDTGGSYASVDDASEVGDAIMDSIDQIEVIETYTVTADFGVDMADSTISIYSDGAYWFTRETDESGHLVLDNVEEGNYSWTCDGIYSGGTITVDGDTTLASVHTTQVYWFTPILTSWRQHTARIGVVCLCVVSASVLVPALLYAIMKRRRSHRTAVHSGTKDASGTYCPNCGQPLNSSVKFCSRCGLRIPTNEKQECEK